ncbi:MAG: asparagine synthase (glutamine-hydrolyzing) [Desulfobacterota bacterium]|nr:asparagine synthase (glutamine-hydrolyzing) [Thermodesulfobacteriota bacterium]
MCGIAGIYKCTGVHPDRKIIKAMSSAIAHRGPDQEGFFCDETVQLACRRLSIIDLDTGDQPVVSEDGQFCIVFNGEIYNYRDIRRELEQRGHIFRTHSDTEVVLEAYRAWGPACLEHFRGMFALCIWNRCERELFLARDRFGIKPLFITELADGSVLFASEIKALLQHPDLAPELYPPALDALFTYGFNLAPYTFFKGIHQVLPGHWISIRPSGKTVHQYWDIPLEAPLLDDSVDEIAAAFRAHVEAAVREGLVADVPVGAYLSGGIDSSTIVSVYSRLVPQQVTTFTITFHDAHYDESAYARRVAAWCGTHAIEFVCTLTPDDIPRLVYHLENPLVSLLNLPLLLLAKKAREQGIKVVLSGDGADEILAGYDYFKVLKAMQFIGRTDSRMRKNVLRRIFPELVSPDNAELHYIHLFSAGARFPVGYPALPYRFQAFQEKQHLYAREFAALLEDTPPEEPFFFDPEQIAHRHLIDQALYLETKMRLLNLTLPLADTMSMAHSVELRPLFLDHRLVEFAFRIPSHLKLHGLTEKYILKKSMAGFVPPEVCKRHKQPLSPPPKWFLAQIDELVQELLSPERIKATGYFDPQYVRHLLWGYRHNPLQDVSGVLVVLFFVQLWHDIFMNRRARW